MKFTTLNVPAEVNRMAKLLAAVMGKPVYQVVTEALQLYEEKHGIKVTKTTES